MALQPFRQIILSHVPFFFQSFIFISGVKSKTLQTQVAAGSHWLAFCMLPESAAVPYEGWSTQRESSCLSVSLQLPGGLSGCVRNKRHLLHHLKAPFHRGIPSQSAKPYNCYGCAEAVLSLTPQALWKILTLFFQASYLHTAVRMYVELHRDTCTRPRMTSGSAVKNRQTTVTN